MFYSLKITESVIYFTSWQQAHKHLTFCVIAHIVFKTSPLVIMEIFFHLISDKTGFSSENAFCNLISAALKKKNKSHKFVLNEKFRYGGEGYISFLSTIKLSKNVTLLNNISTLLSSLWHITKGSPYLSLVLSFSFIFVS